MESQHNAEGVANLKELARRLTQDHNSNKKVQKVPIVMVPGFSGWGTPLFGTVNYWGGIENIPRQLAKEGYTVIVTPIAPLSSNWERACELFAQLTSGRFTWYDLEKGTFKDDSEGIKVDYGGIFPDKHGYEQHTEKRKLPIIFTQDREMKTRKPWVWSGNTPVHFICHSQGGNTVRYLLHLMEHGSRGLIDGTLSDIPAHLTYFDKPGRSKWAISVSTIGTPHRGTTIFDALQNYFRVSTTEGRIKLIGRLFATLSFNDTYHRFYDLQLDHWGIKKGQTAAGTEESFPEMRKRLESLIYQAQPGPVRRWLESNHNGLYDNTIVGVNNLNNSTIPTSGDVYYFSLSFSCVEPSPNDWPPWTLDALRSFPLTTARFLNSIPIISNIAQFVQGALNSIPFIGPIIPNIPELSGQLADGIARLIIDAGVSIGGWYTVSTLTRFREVMSWATDNVVNHFLEYIGYRIRIPGPPDYLPIPTVFPPMLPAAYAIGCYNLTESQTKILGDDTHDWKANDGIVNTASMKGPLNRNGDQHNNRTKDLIADARQFPHGLEEVETARGKYWHFGVTTGLDHADEIGIFIQEDASKLTVDMYKALATIVSRLPH